MKNCKEVVSIGMLLVAVNHTLAAGVSCSDGQRYYDLGRKAGAQQDFEQAARWLNKSVQACDSYVAWHLLGAAYQKERKLEQALRAYEQAVQFAQDSDRAAVSLARYGQVLALNGQRFEALTMLDRAIDSHSNPPSWMRENARQLDHSLVDKPISGDSIKRSLASQEFGLLSANGPASGRFGGADDRIKIRIPINYKLDSVEMDELTSDNIEELGRVLASDNYQGHTFTLVGHTDVRGTRDHNFTLSEQRAEAAREELLQKFPALGNRLQVEGAGESKPKYRGEDLPEADHRLNRRLEVFVN
ncbi:MAG: OmpA family protein [Parahaliea sp.]